MKTCSKCNQSKPFEEFFKRGNGYQDWCKLCNKDHKRDWIRKNRDKVRWNRLWSLYRLRQEDWDRMIQDQGNVCAVCRTKEPVAVDHDHSCCSGYKSCGACVRGIVCHQCNALVARIENDPVFLDNLTSYLNK